MKKKNEWFNVPKKSLGCWFSEWAIASLVLKARKEDKLPTKFKLSSPLVKENKDGSADIIFEVRYD